MATFDPPPEASGSQGSPHRRSPTPSERINVDGSPIHIMRPQDAPRARFSMFNQAPEDVIVVDSGSEDDEVQVIESLRHRKRQRREPASAGVPPEVISLVDDEDDEVAPAHIASTSQPIPRERLFSPPPPPAVNHGRPPPLPRMPRHLHPHLNPYPAMRARPPPDPSADAGPIRPVVRPPEFDILYTPPRSRAASPPRMAARPAAAFAPHTMGLGGAIMTTANQQRAAERRARMLRQEYVAARGHRGVGSALARQHVMQVFAYPSYDGPAALWEDADDPTYSAVHKLRKPEPDYKPSYTHPEPAEPGFTYDFEVAPAEQSCFPSSSRDAPIVIEDDGTIHEPTVAPSLTLRNLFVCSNCQDPISLDAGRPDDKIWSLRCGHTIDGKCLTKLSIPIPVLGESEPSSKKRKGKGKAVDTSTFIEEPSSMRSRLRSHDAGGFMEGLMDVGTSIMGRMRKAKVTKPKIEQEHQWKCPVPSCGREHTSVKMDGVWQPEKARGEGVIGLFV